VRCLRVLIEITIDRLLGKLRSSCVHSIQTFHLVCNSAKMLWVKSEGVTERLRELRSENLYTSSNVVRVVISRTTQWTGRVERMGEKRNACRILVGKRKEKRPLA